MKKYEARERRSRSRSNTSLKRANRELGATQEFVDNVHQMGDDFKDAQQAVGDAANVKLREIEEQERLKRQ